MNIKRPTLLINEAVARKNIARMANKAKSSGVELVPHFKTPQSIQIGQWYKDEGIISITVSSVSMAKYFQQGGWENITIAFPLNIQEIDDVSELANKTNLTLLVNEPGQVEVLKSNVSTVTDVVIEVDCGSKRSGVDPGDHEVIQRMIDLLENSPHQFKGFYSHFGHTYNARSKEEILGVFKASLEILHALKERFSDYGPQLSIGDTPSASILDKFESVKSIHAGNFVFYDLMQVQIGACDEQDIAVVLACPVVSKNHKRNEVVVYGGGVHLSKESMFDRELNTTIYGKPVRITATGWSEYIPGSYVKSLSQEHGIIHLNDEAYESFNVGDTIGILPVHSCMTADSMREYIDLKGDKFDHL
ncbi:MAG: alanine racemase [Bacteroidota bacterium]